MEKRQVSGAGTGGHSYAKKEKKNALAPNPQFVKINPKWVTVLNIKLKARKKIREIF